MSEQPLRLSRRTFLRTVAGGGLCAGALSMFTAEQTQAQEPDPDTLVIGHRGAMGIEPDNTMRAIERALELGVDGVEIDIRETSDGELILMHDPVLNLATDGHGFVEETPYSEIRELDVEGEPIPRLDEALDYLAQTDARVYLDIKSSGITPRVLDAVRDRDMEDRSTLLAFEPEKLAPATDADVELGLLGKVPNRFVTDEAVDVGTDLVLVHYVPEAIPHFSTRAHTRNVTPGVWSLMDREWSIKEALASDLDIIITNRPDIAVPLRNEA